MATRVEMIGLMRAAGRSDEALWRTSAQAWSSVGEDLLSVPESLAFSSAWDLFPAPSTYTQVT